MTAGRLGRTTDFAPRASAERRLLPLVRGVEHARPIGLDAWVESSTGDPMHKLMLVRAGQIDLQGAAGSWLILPGHLVFLPADRPYILRSAAGTRLSVVYLREEATRWDHGGCWVNGCTALAREMIAQAESWAPEEAAQSDEARIFFRAIAALVRGWFANPRMSWLPSARSEALRRVLDHIEAALAGVTVRSAAEAAGLSVRTLQRRCREEFGMSWRQLINEARMIRAMELLAGPGSVAEIAEATGFASMGAFTHAFSSRFGTTPRNFARLARAEAGPEIPAPP